MQYDATTQSAEAVIVVEKPSAWDIVHAIAMAIACLVSYTVMTELLNVAVEGHSDLVGGMWAAIATAFVFRDSRQRSLRLS
jgi:diacylglycerol kinase